MKRILLPSLIFVSVLAPAQKKFANILKSSNILEIENFLRTSHPEDSIRSIMKSKLIALKNASSNKVGQSTSSIAKPVIKDIPRNALKQRNDSEKEEFDRLFKLSSTAHKEKTVKLLNQLFSKDVSDTEAVLLIENRSDCNMIVRIQGSEFYNLAVPAHGENSLVVKKGDYQFTSKVCDAKYSSVKNISKNLLVTLNSPVLVRNKEWYTNTENPAKSPNSIAH